MRILSLDPATKCGYAIAEGGKLAESGVWLLTPKRDESKGVRVLRFKQRLCAILDSRKVDLVAFEAARHAAPGMQGALVTQAELQGVLKAECEARGIAYAGYSPTEVKKHATGRGNAGKADVIAAINARHGITVKDDNQSDAIAILDLALQQFENTTLG